MNYMHEKMQEIESYALMILESSLLPILHVQEGNIVYANAQARLLFMGDKAVALEGQMISKCIFNKNSDIKALLDNCSAMGVASEHKDYVGVDKNGNEFLVRLLIMPAQYNGQKISRVIVNKLMDESSSQLEEKGGDGLRATESIASPPAILAKALGNAAKGRHVTLLTIRVENIKKIEATLGANEISKVVVEVINKIKSVLGKGVLVESTSASLFHILVGTQDGSKLKQVANSLSHAMKELAIEVSEQVIQAATFISVLPIDNAGDIDLLLSRVEQSLQKASEKGINSWHMFNDKEDLVEQACQGDALALLRYGMENNKLRLLYQPVMSLTGDMDEHYAVLVRIIDPNGKEIVAEEFIHAVDQLSMPAKLDRWIILNSIKQLALRNKAGKKKTRLFIHLSPVSLLDKQLLPWLVSVLKKIPIDADSLIFQFTENDAMSFRPDIDRLLEGAKKIGFRTSLCDFGLSMKSMKMAEVLATHYVRLDASITRSMENDKEQENIVSEVIDKLVKLQRKTIVMSIESPNELGIFWGTSVDYAQGFFVQHPKQDMDFDFSMDE